MEKESLYIYTEDDFGNKVNFPDKEKPAIRIGQFTYTAQRMAGTPTITATLHYHRCMDEMWTKKEFVEFRGERYYLTQVPTSSKDNKSVMYKHELQFVSERIVLENVYFRDVVTAGADTYHSNSTKVKFMGDIREFVARLNASMQKSKTGYAVVIDEDVETESKLVVLDDVYIADALQSIYTLFDLPYYFKGKICHVGYTDHVISTEFEYMQGLVSIKKTNANYKIINRITGTGSSDNLPFYYPNSDASGTIDRSPVLMPSIYRLSGGANMFYDATGDAYPNPYTPATVSEGNVSFPDIKPSIKGITNGAGEMIGEIAAIAFDANDNDEFGTGAENNVFNGKDEYVHSYFYIKLHPFSGSYGFNLFEHGLEGGRAVINMTTGNCAACEFEIGVTYKEDEPGRAFNPVLVDENGNLLPGDFEEKVTSDPELYVERQQDTSTNDVWIAVKKDNSSFGVLMPNATQGYRPKAGDRFVITGIKLPQAYISRAESELDAALKKNMLENNDEKFTFSVNFSRVYLAENESIANALNENSRIYIRYDNRVYLMYVSSFTCKADQHCLYDISVELTDKLSANVSSLRSTIAEIAGEIIGSRLPSGGGGWGGGTSVSKDTLASMARHFLRKDQQDAARYLIKFLEGIQTGNFVHGAHGGYISPEGIAELEGITVRDRIVSDDFVANVLGAGFGLLKRDATGHSYLEVDKLFVRLKAIFAELEIRKLSYSGGNYVFSPAGMKCVKVEELADVWRCYFTADDGDDAVENLFRVDDLVQAREFNVKAGVHENVENRYFWRRCVGTGDDYIDLSKTDRDMTSDDAPKAGDALVTIGNKRDKERQNAIVISVFGEGSPSIIQYVGIDDYTMSGKAKTIISPNGNYFTGSFKFESGKDVESEIKDVNDKADETLGKVDQAVDDLAENINFTMQLSNDLKAVKNQVDGAIETWFYDPVPTLANKPAVDWKTEAERNVHLGDLYYDGNGKAYRFQMEGSVYLWKVITDSDITKALSDAKRAQDTADGKRRVFVQQPTNASAYDVGDLWVNASFGTEYKNDLLRCKVAKAAGAAFSVGHWEKASDYTDDTRANEAIDKAAQAELAAQAAQEAADEANGAIAEMNNDGILDIHEKQSIRTQWENINGVGNTTASGATGSYSKTKAIGAGLVELTALDGAYAALRTYLNGMGLYTNANTGGFNRAEMAAKFTAYYDAEIAVNTAVAERLSKEAADKIEIGGRNLFRNSELLHSVAGPNYTHTNRKPTLKLKPDTDYMVSVGKTVIESGTSVDRFTILVYSYNDDAKDIEILFPISAERQSAKLHLSDRLNPDFDWCILFYPGKSWESADRAVSWYDVKFEEGNKATAWSPAPEDVKAASDAAKAAADAAQESADKANTLLADIANDGKLTAMEKQAAKKEWDVIVSEKPKCVAEGVKFGVVTSVYEGAYEALRVYVTPLLANLGVTSDIVGSTFRGKFKDYYDARTDLLNAISTKAKELADAAQAKADESERQLAVITEKQAGFEADMEGMRSYASETRTTLEGTQEELENMGGRVLSVETSVSSIEQRADSIEMNVGTVTETVAGMEVLLDAMADDGKMTPVEKQAVYVELTSIRGGHSELLAKAQSLNINVNDFNGAYNGLEDYLRPLLADLGSTSDVDRDAFRLRFSAYYEEKERVQLLIAGHAEDLANGAYDQADAAQEAAEAAQAEADAANEAAAAAGAAASDAASAAAQAQAEAERVGGIVDDMAADGKLTPLEKKAVKLEWDSIYKEYDDIKTQALNYGLYSSYFTSIYNTLRDYIQPLLADMNSTSDIVRSTFSARFNDYYTEKSDILLEISKAAKGVADSAQSAADTANTNAGNAKKAADEAKNAADAAKGVADGVYGDFVTYKQEVGTKFDQTDGKLSMIATKEQWTELGSGSTATLMAKVASLEVTPDRIWGMIENKVDGKVAGFVTTDEGNTFWAKKELENGEVLVSKINQTAEGITIKGNKVEIDGRTVFKDSKGNVVNIFGTNETDVLTINGGVFKVDKYGSITATSGKIGGFSIGTSSLGISSAVDGSSYGMGLKSGYIRFRDKDTLAAIGNDLFVSSTGIPGVGRFENHEYQPAIDNVGVWIDVTGSNGYNNALHVENGNIRMENGKILRFSLDYIAKTSGSYSIKDSDAQTLFIGDGTSKIDFVAPPNPQYGRVIIVKNYGSYDVGFSGGSHLIKWRGSTYKWSIIKGQSGGSAGCQIYVFTGYYWYCLIEGANGTYSYGSS